MEERKLNFLARVKNAITNFDMYQNFATENTTKAIKYFFQLLLAFTIIVSIANTINLGTIFNEAAEFFKSDVPNFTFENNTLTVENNEEPIVYTNDKIFGIVILATNVTEEMEINDNIKKMEMYNNGIMFLKDKCILKSNTITGNMTYNYSDIVQANNIQDFNKQNIVDYLNNNGLYAIYFALFMSMIIYIFIAYLLLYILDILILSLLGFLTTRIYRVKMKYNATLNMAIYALTLPIILNMIYIVVNIFTGFTIKYFQIMYNIISYIYIITAIIIIKTDLKKKKIEVEKIIDEQKKVNEEQEKQEEQQKEDKQEEKKKQKDEKDKNNGEEPEGSKA